MTNNTTSIQTTYAYDRPLAISGALADNGPHYAPPAIGAAEALQAGKAGIWANAAKTLVRMPKRNTQVTTFSAALGASNRYQMTMTTTAIDGTVVTVALDTTYGTSAAATYAAIIAQAHAADADITGAAVGDTITFSVASNKYLTVTVTGAVTGGSAVTVTESYGSNDGAASAFAGIIGRERGQVQQSDGASSYTVRYAAGDAVTLWRQGRVWVVNGGSTLAAGATAYFRFVAGSADDTERGSLTDAVGSPVVAFSSAYVTIDQGAAANGLCKLSINLP